MGSGGGKRRWDNRPFGSLPSFNLTNSDGAHVRCSGMWACKSSTWSHGLLFKCHFSRRTNRSSHGVQCFHAIFVSISLSVPFFFQLHFPVPQTGRARVWNIHGLKGLRTSKQAVKAPRPPLTHPLESFDTCRGVKRHGPGSLWLYQLRVVLLPPLQLHKSWYPLTDRVLTALRCFRYHSQLVLSHTAAASRRPATDQERARPLLGEQSGCVGKVWRRQLMRRRLSRCHGGIRPS